MLSVEAISRMAGYVAGKVPIERYIEKQKIAAEDIEDVRWWWAEHEKNLEAAQKSGTAMMIPNEWN